MLVLHWSLDSILYRDWSTGWTAEELWFSPCQEQETSLFTKLSSQALVPTHPPVQRVLGGPFQGMKVTRV